MKLTLIIMGLAWTVVLCWAVYRTRRLRAEQDLYVDLRSPALWRLIEEAERRRIW
jgi:hypothetical protein